MIIDLPSSASHHDFPDNTNSNFKVRLPQVLRLEPEKWKVSLLEAQIPNKFYTIRKGEVTFTIDGRSSTHFITKGFYSTPDNLVQHFNASALGWMVHGKAASDIILLVYDKISNKSALRVSRIPGTSGITVDMSDDLRAFLGFDDTVFTEGVHTAKRLCNPFVELSYLMVYTNLVKSRMVGDIQSPLLRIIPVHGSYGDANHEFRHLHFVEAEAFSSDVVEVNIRTDTGKLVPFVDGKVMLTLQLERI